MTHARHCASIAPKRSGWRVRSMSASVSVFRSSIFLRSAIDHRRSRLNSVTSICSCSEARPPPACSRSAPESRIGREVDIHYLRGNSRRSPDPPDVLEFSQPQADLLVCRAVSAGLASSIKPAGHSKSAARPVPRKAGGPQDADQKSGAAHRIERQHRHRIAVVLDFVIDDIAGFEPQPDQAERGPAIIEAAGPKDVRRHDQVLVRHGCAEDEAPLSANRNPCRDHGEYIRHWVGQT
jgi:hypothetical protein